MCHSQISKEIVFQRLYSKNVTHFAQDLTQAARVVVSIIMCPRLCGMIPHNVEESPLSLTLQFYVIIVQWLCQAVTSYLLSDV